MNRTTRTVEFLEVGKDMAQVGTRLHDALDAKVEVFDSLASRIATIIFGDWGIPDRFIDDDLSGIVLGYMDGLEIEVSQVIEKLKLKLVEMEYVGYLTMPEGSMDTMMAAYMLDESNGTGLKKVPFIVANAAHIENQDKVSGE